MAGISTTEQRESVMGDVTVEQLAGVVGIPVERLLRQMKDAGLTHADASSSVNDEEKQKLLSFLKKSHGENSEEKAGKRITLKRKSLSKLKVSSASGKSKTVSVEVRKKRTYVKRPSAEEEVGELSPDMAKPGTGESAPPSMRRA